MYCQSFILMGFVFATVLAGNAVQVEDTPEPLEKPTVPTECTEANKGRCECGDTTQGFVTLTFWLEGEQRCFTVFRPKARAEEKLPILIYPHCYSMDRLSGISMNSKNRGWNKAATRYGFARIGLSTPSGNWKFGNDAIVNDTIPMPCSVHDSKDVKYMLAVASYIEANQDLFDISKIWVHGFSQNAAFSAYLGYCFSDYVTGVFMGGSGLSMNGKGPTKPACQAWVSGPQRKECKDNLGIQDCKECAEKYPCTECQYWPIYPCYSPVKPMIGCMAAYDNDAIANIVGDPIAGKPLYMYEALKNEGHDPRLLRFSPSEDGTIKGQHKPPRNDIYWTIGCLGMAEQCSEECESSLIACVESSDTSTALKRTKAFDACMSTSVISGLQGCTKDCAPTFNMLATSEMPTYYLFDRFGTGNGTDLLSANVRPESSKCTTAEAIHFDIE